MSGWESSQPVHDSVCEMCGCQLPYRYIVSVLKFLEHPDVLKCVFDDMRLCFLYLV